MRFVGVVGWLMADYGAGSEGRLTFLYVEFLSSTHRQGFLFRRLPICFEMSRCLNPGRLRGRTAEAV